MFILGGHEVKIKIGLIWRIVIAIALAVILGMLLPKIPVIGEAFSEWFVRLAATFNMIFGGFLNFVVPLIIIGFIAPGIAKLGKGSGKLLGLATGFAYFSTYRGRDYCLFRSNGTIAWFDRRTWRWNCWRREVGKRQQHFLNWK